MRWIFAIAVAIIGLIWLASELDVSLSFGEGNFAPTTWRRTADGWEKVSAVSGMRLPASAVAEVWNTHPHPATVSLFVAFVSLLVLFLFSPTKRPERKPDRPKVHPAFGEQTLRSRAWVDESSLR